MQTQSLPWDELATLDPMWAILSHPERRGGRWDPQTFFETGAMEADKAMNAARTYGLPGRHTSALDYGCGIGRVTLGLTRYFERVVGVDTSPRMVHSARAASGNQRGVEFSVLDGAPLAGIRGAPFDLVYTCLVLQHLPSRPAIEATVRELIGVLRPGGFMLIQVPSAIPLSKRLQLRAKAYRLLRSLALSPGVLFRLGLDPITMRSVREERMRHLIAAAGADTLAVVADDKAGPVIQSRTYHISIKP